MGQHDLLRVLSDLICGCGTTAAETGIAHWQHSFMVPVLINNQDVRLSSRNPRGWPAAHIGYRELLRLGLLKRNNRPR